tara:strand:+ start:357 stop:686 length:330 start_codon:yes stop_codon:yes gene_type:complete
MKDYNYNTHHNAEIDTSNAEFIDTVKASFTQLIAAFGKPIADTLDPVAHWRWTIEFADGIIATIYNMRNEMQYGFDPEEKDTWHVGGNTNEAIVNVNYHVGMAKHEGIE